MDTPNSGPSPESAEIRVPSDAPLSGEELSKRVLSFESHPVTPAAHGWLKAEGIAFDRDLRAMLIRRAKNEGQQLTLGVVKSIRAAFITNLEKGREEHERLYESRADADAPNGEEESCSFPVARNGETVPCGEKLKPTTWNKVVSGKVFRHRAGPLSGQPIREGCFGVADTENGKQPAPLCRTHVRLVKQNGGRVYPYRRAIELCQSKVVETESLSAFIDRDYADRRNKRDFRGGRSGDGGQRRR